MPLKKLNKHKTSVKRINLRKHQIDIKKRLLEISIRVDCYIYKNKPITEEEAEKYLHEISVLQTYSNNDIHIFQVIEKLTRCMKTILEESKIEIPNQNVATSKNEPSVNWFPVSSSLSNKHEGDNKLIIDNCNLRAPTQPISKSKDQNSNVTVANVIPDNETEETGKRNNAELVVYNKDVNIASTIGTNEYNLYEKNNNRTNVSNVMDVNIKDIATHHSHTNTMNVENTEHSKPDKIHYSNIACKEKDNTKTKCKLILADNVRKTKIKKKITEKNPIPSIHPADGKNNKNKNITKVIRKHTKCDCEATISTTTIKQRKISSKTNKKGESKKTVNKKLPDATNRRKKSTNKNNTTVPTKFKELNTPSSSFINKHTHINITSVELPLPEVRANNNEVRTIVTNHDLIANQMGALTINNECIPNDLSWVEQIRYVREISTDEFDQTPDRFNETFWGNFALPSGWNDVDFLD